LSDEELRAILFATLDVGPPFDALIRLLVATGQRRDEVAGITWAELDQHRAEWPLAADRTKNGRAHVVPLNDRAVGQLDTLAGAKPWPHEGFVFATNGRTPVSGFPRVKNPLRSHHSNAGQRGGCTLALA
jgi:integrase